MKPLKDRRTPGHGPVVRALAFRELALDRLECT